MAMNAENKMVVPNHIAIIMDGNGRWAKKRGLPRTAGHAAGAEAFRRTANYCRSIGVKYLTVYAFSTENWKRSQEEISGIMTLMGRYLREALRDMEKNRVRFKVFGDIAPLSPELQKLCMDAQERSKDYDDVQVNFCLNYGGRDEIVKAAAKMGAVKTGALILIEQEVPLGDLERTGIPIDAIVSSQLLINIFEHNTPLHDGAVIVRHNRVAAATCFLPLTDSNEISMELGTRHRAALGLSETCDAVIVVVSEETGIISLTAEILIKLADYYNVSIDYLLDRTNNPTLQK